MDFDLFPGNHNLKAEAVELIRDKYSQYLKTEKLTPSNHVTVTPTVVRLQVRLQHAHDWFTFVYGTCVHWGNLDRIRTNLSPLGEEGRYALSTNLLRCVAKVDDGQVVAVNEREFTRFIEDLTLDYKILLQMSPRDFERAIAAVYSKLSLIHI